MTGMDLIERPDEGALMADPVEYMALVLNRAKGWLTEAQSVEEVRNTKAIAVGYESVIREKELAMDAEMSATEIVRRCERRIGELVRTGQEDGTIAKRGSNTRTDLVGAAYEVPVSVTEAAGVKNRSEVKPLYDLADAPAEVFDNALTEARGEGDLSRANVVRKVKGEERPITDRDRIKSQAREKRMWGALTQLEELSKVMPDMPFPSMTEPAEVQDMLGCVERSIQNLHRLRKQLRSRS